MKKAMRQSWTMEPAKELNRKLAEQMRTMNEQETVRL
jgi:hypothetical protein